MTRKQVRKHDRICMVVILVVMVVAVLHMVTTTIRGNERQQAEEEQKQKTIEQIQNAKSMDDLSMGVERVLQLPNHLHETTQEAEPEEVKPESDEFVFYQIPEQYARYGGELPEDVQQYTYTLCKEEGVRYALIIAMIEMESAYKSDRIGDDGESLGYMQVMQKWHEERMESLGADDLLDPYQNIRVGVDYIKELIKRYGTIQDALTAYNYGAAGAEEHLWSNEIYAYPYNERIMERMKEIEEELGK